MVTELEVPAAPFTDTIDSTVPGTLAATEKLSDELPLLVTTNVCEYCVPLLGSLLVEAASGVTATLLATGGMTSVDVRSDTVGVRVEVAVSDTGIVRPPWPGATS